MTEPLRHRAGDRGPPPLSIHRPAAPAAPLVLASAHSGADYPPEFAGMSRLSPAALRLSEDCFVDELCLRPHPDLPHIRAHFPRAWCDANRAAWELDPAMFRDALPPWVQTDSARVRAGLGTIARLVGSNEPIYRDKLRWSDAVSRVETCWQPYHAGLRSLLDETAGRFGVAVLIDCHSMPTIAGVADLVLGDAHGSACGGALVRAAENAARDHGLLVRRNDPYAGGYVTRHYGRPVTGIHALQVEVARHLYMDEARLEPLPCFGEVQAVFAGMVAAVTAAAAELRQPARGAKRNGGALRHRRI